MNSNYTRRAILQRLLLMVLCVVGACFSVYYNVWELLLLSVITILVLIWNLVWMVEGVYRKLHLFFDAIKYEDGSLRFSENQADKHLKGLYQNLNRINNIINDIRVKEAGSKRFFLEFMKGSASGLMALDVNKNVEVVNDAALAMMGLANLTHLDRLQQHQPALHELILNLKPGQSESIKIAEGCQLRLIAVKVACIHFSDKEYRIYSLYDIKNEIEENELETWQKLIRIMIHEIMNSIAPITSMSQTLNRYFTKNNRVTRLEELKQTEIDNTAKGLAVIEERAVGLRGFVVNYRKLNDVPQPEFTSINLKEWLDSIRLLFRGQEEEQNIKLSITNTYTKSAFTGDERLLTHVLLNLLNNATQALEGRENKQIEIVVEKGRSGAPRILLIDNGKGFKAEEADQIFLPFYTTRKKGSGIGLSLSRQILRMHKGSISASSEPEVRTEFVLEL